MKQKKIGIFVTWILAFKRDFLNLTRDPEFHLRNGQLKYSDILGDNVEGFLKHLSFFSTYKTDQICPLSLGTDSFV